MLTDLGPLTAERLREVLTYCSRSGEFRWRASTDRAGRKRWYVGRIAGWRDADGYRKVTVDKHRYFAHRLAWLYVYGSWPKGELDHRNGRVGDFRIENLREASRSENMQNLQKAHRDNKTGLLGVRYRKHCGLFAAEITVNRQGQHLGYFRTAEEAHAAYLKAKAATHPFGRR